MRLDQPPNEEEMPPSMQDVMHPPIHDITSPAPIEEIRTPPNKSPNRESLSATRRAKSRALIAKKELNLLTVTNKNSKLMSFMKSSHETVIDSDASTISETFALLHAVYQRLSGRLPNQLRWDYSHHSCSRPL